MFETNEENYFKWKKQVEFALKIMLKFDNYNYIIADNLINQLLKITFLQTNGKQQVMQF